VEKALRVLLDDQRASPHLGVDLAEDRSYRADVSRSLGFHQADSKVARLLALKNRSRAGAASVN
jgi:hypothetical protein